MPGTPFFSMPAVQRASRKPADRYHIVFKAFHHYYKVHKMQLMDFEKVGLKTTL